MTYAATAVYVAIAAAGVSAYAGYTQAQTGKAIAKHNTEVADLGAADALKRGEQARIDARHRGQILQGQQRTALSARGLDLGEGTASDILAQSEFFTLSDEATARTNGRKEAWAKEAQAQSFQLEEGGINPGLTLAGSLLSSSSSVASRWQTYKQS